MPELYEHQQRILEAMKQRPMLVAADPGCGKTACGLKLAEHLKAHPQRSGKTLVVAPLSLLESAWAEDCAKFTPELKFRNLWASSPLRRRNLLTNTSGDIFVVNSEGFKRIVPWCRQQNFDVLIVDESSCMVNPKSQITKALINFAVNIPSKHCFSGTPMPNSVLDIWGQMAVVNPNLLGWHFWTFRSKWAYQTGYMGYDWKVTPEQRAQLMQTISPNAVFISKEDCLDLPEQVFEVRHVYMDAAQREAYDRMVRDKILPLIGDKTAVAANVLSEIMKLRQLTSGWLRAQDGTDYTFTDTKARVLEEVLEELGDHQAIIWCEFRHDIDELTKRLAPKAIKILGGLGPDEVQRRLNAFKAGEAQYLVAHPKTIGHGVTLTNCSYMIFYSLSYSWQNYYQSCSRIHRISQTQKCTYLHLLCRKSIDEAIYRALQSKDDMAKAAMAYLREQTA